MVLPDHRAFRGAPDGVSGAIATYAAYQRGVEHEFDLDTKAGEMLKGIDHVRGDENDRRLTKDLSLVEAEARWRALEHDACNLIEQVVAARATSLDGFKAKLSVLGRVYLYGTDKYDDGFDGYKPDLVCSLLRDFGTPTRAIDSPDAAITPSERKPDPAWPDSLGELKDDDDDSGPNCYRDWMYFLNRNLAAAIPRLAA
jgi:hypothetical protein